MSVSDWLCCLSKQSRNTLHQHKRPTVKIVIHLLVFKALGLCLYFRVFFNFCIPVIPCIASDAHQGPGETSNMKRRIFFWPGLLPRKADHSCAGTWHIPVLYSHEPPSFTDLIVLLFFWRALCVHLLGSSLSNQPVSVSQSWTKFLQWCWSK